MILMTNEYNAYMYIYIYMCVCVFVEPIVATRYGVQRGGQQMAAQAKATRERQSMM